MEPTRQQLLYQAPGDEKGIPEPLDDDLRSLSDFGVASGGTIVVEDACASTSVVLGAAAVGLGIDGGHGRHELPVV